MRHRLIGHPAIWLLVCLFSASIFAAKFSARAVDLQVNESATRFFLKGKDAVVTLALENQSAGPTSVQIKLDLIDSREALRAMAVRVISVPLGSSLSTIVLVKTGLGAYVEKDLLWYRLRYEITTMRGMEDKSTGSGSRISGLISLSEITPGIFKLQVSAPQDVGKEPKYVIRAHALHPLTGAPAVGVSLEARMIYEEGEEKRESQTKGVTNSIGEALLEFKLPGPLIAEEVKLRVVARRDGFQQEAEEEVSLLYPNQVLISADKPLYQPGQTLRLRVLGLDRDRMAWGNVDGKLKIYDVAQETVFRADFKTSRFGVADAEWKIPDNARLGNYFIEAHIGEESPRRGYGSSMVRISRYDLPNFAVSVKPDRSYYLPGQDAEVEVRADYLFGQPVKKGRARIVRETERQWNYREQKWETEEGDKYEGSLDDQGRFIARVKLNQEHEEFEPGLYSKFRDLRYAAYLTDLTTGRTEQRRFDLRITKDPIHVYLIERGGGAGMPLQFYVSTFYADGTPAECSLEVRRILDDESEDDNEDERRVKQSAPSGGLDQPLVELKTNRYGVAKAASVDIGKDARLEDLRLKITARDAQGGMGAEVHKDWNHRLATILVETDKTLYRAGEPIKARLTTDSRQTNWVIDLMRGPRPLVTRLAQLQEGRAEITFPFSQEFKGELKIMARPAFIDASDYWNSTGFVTVLYPRDRELKLDVKFDQASYRPGAEARADLRAFTSQGDVAETALGVVIFDKAIEERARTDQEFSGRAFGFYDCFQELLGAKETLAGVTRRDLDRLDLSKPLPDGMELVAEILLNQQIYGSMSRGIFGGDEFQTDADSVFSSEITSQLKPVDGALSSLQALKSVYPTDDTTLHRIMLLAGIGLDEMRDPWGSPYRLKFTVEKIHDIFELISAGPDKRFDTADDFTALRKSWQYFSYTAAAIARTVEDYHARVGGFIRDRETLKRELLAREAIDLDATRDRWGHPYRFEFGVEQRSFSIRVNSAGPNGKFEDKREKGSSTISDDFTVGACLIDYTSEIKARFNRALAANYKKTKLIPMEVGALRDALKQSGVDFDELRDGWGNSYYPTFRTFSRYSDRVRQIDQARFGEKPKPITEVIPVTEQIFHVSLRSKGADNKEGTYDDFDVAEFSQLIAEESAKQAVEKIAGASKPKVVSFSGDGGAIRGVIVDMNDAVIMGATVTAKHTGSGSVWKAKANGNGEYLLHNLAPGIYEIEFSSTGFRTTVISGVAVYASKMTKVDGTLNVGAATETVMVTADVPQLMTESASVSATARSRPVIPNMNPSQIATPRLREYFPETLLWLPQIETDKQGRAQLKFKLADNITTWKMAIIGSTIDGEIGVAEKEFTAFQPFFAEHDPPKVLTEGDEISLPVVLRNYLDKTQTVAAEIKPENWFELLSGHSKRANVSAGDAARVIFDFRAVASIKSGKQRVTAHGSDASDAIEKPVSVHPDGEEIAQTASDVFTNSGALEINIPANIITGSAQAELKIYPNLIAHALEGIEGILQRPYGCGEQTISSTYPNLMILRYLEPQNEHISTSTRKVAEKARRFTQAGYDRLLGYRAESGGFSYWGRGEADLALTAYALRFLSDASDFIKVDEDMVDDARKFILSQQQPDGRWLAGYAGKQEDARRTALNTAFIAHTLAAENVSPQNDKAFTSALGRALDYLAKRVDEIDEPYLIASYALAAMGAGEKAGATKAIAKLRTLAREDAGTIYWGLESNTPFHGWGLAGRIETTALAVRALKRDGAIRGQGDEAKDSDLVSRGLLFLLRNKDRYGVWFSTQATISALDTLISLNGSEIVKAGATGQAEIYVNKKRVASLPMAPGGQLSNPITFDLSSFLSQGKNRVDIRRSGEATRASAQVVETHYEPWGQGAIERRENGALRNASSLRLAVNYDRTEAKVGDEVTCSVVAERVGAGPANGQSYGMLLAEIGLAPGADVDRESLEQAMKESSGELNQYDILPDRVIVYLWPRAGGLKFSFKFKPRYGVKAQSAPSALYDYYNPEARVLVAPTRFIVR